MSILDKPQLAGIAIGKGYRKVKRLTYTAATSLVGLSGFVPERISKAPPDLKTADPVLVQDFYSGRYIFGGKLIDMRGHDPFSLGSQGEAWDRELHGFEWLRHFSANTDKLSPNQARALISDWIAAYRKPSGSACWDIETASRRLISWLSNSVMIISNCEDRFYQQFMRSLGAHALFLKREVAGAPEGMPKFYATIALSYASICFEGHKNQLDDSRARLAYELANQILPDGGHVSRNPACIVEILLFLLPYKQACEASGIQIQNEILQAIDRMLPALRYFRLTDGSITRFNGAGHINRDYLATLMRHNQSTGKLIMDASYSCYQRMEVGDGVLLMDVGDPPKGELSTYAHAGCLSFEFSNGQDCIVTNCGKPKHVDADDDPVWRSTDAHSTAILNGTSSCKFESASSDSRYGNGQIYAGQLRVESAREDTEHYSAVSAAHYGYVRDFGIRHQRNIILDSNGERLSGNDWFSSSDKGGLAPTALDSAKLRFHLSPDVKASMSRDGQYCILETKSGSKWVFSAPGFKIVLEESIFFAGLIGAVSNWQIVIGARVATTPEIKWVLQKLDVDQAKAKSEN